jgi:nitrogen fixation-related uncharacterized protein
MKRFFPIKYDPIKDLIRTDQEWIDSVNKYTLIPLKKRNKLHGLFSILNFLILSWNLYNLIVSKNPSLYILIIIPIFATLYSFYWFIKTKLQCDDLKRKLKNYKTAAIIKAKLEILDEKIK